MAKAPKSLNPEVAPEVAPEVTPKVAPAAARPDPVIEYIGDGARDIEFTPSPNATRVVINGTSGIIMEYLA